MLAGEMAGAQSHNIFRGDESVKKFNYKLLKAGDGFKSNEPA
jgi:hypothetical protein